MADQSLKQLLSRNPPSRVQEAIEPEFPRTGGGTFEITAPPYGHRKNWIPRTEEDFGGGGAFPEIHVAQYPLGMGKEDELGSCKTIQSLDELDLAPRKKVFGRYTDLLPNQATPERRPNEEEIREKTEETRRALERLVSSKISAAMPVQHAQKQAPAQFVRYTPANTFAGGAQQRIIRMVTAQKDPMEPPKFKINAKIPRGPPSPPVPVLHSPSRKVSAKEQQTWKIPPCISNWKNPKGYTIPLDKRLAADGRGLQSVHINEGFARLAEALYVADREAREAIEARAQLERRLAQKEKDRKEEELRRLADQARAARSGPTSRGSSNLDPEEAERDDIRRERQRDRQRQRAIQRAAPEKRTKLMKERERDITESIALGVPNRSAVNQEFDTRLMDMSKGLDSGFAADDVYAVYDKPWREDNAIANTLYRPSKNLDSEIYGDDLEKVANARQFVGGRDAAPRQSGPVLFEKKEIQQNKGEDEDRKRQRHDDDDDPFGLGQFFEQVKKGKSEGDEGKRKHERRRRDD